MMLVSAGFLMFAIVCINRVVRADEMMGEVEEQLHPEKTGVNTEDKEQSLQGGLWAGVALVAKSPYLLGICALMLCYSVLSTFLYFQQVQIIAEHFSDSQARTVMFARVDLVVNVLTIILQLFVTSKLIRWLGIGRTLAIVPLVLALGLLLLGMAPTLGLSMLVVVIGLQIVRRAGYYSIINPAREALYVVLSRAEKYKAKNFVDTSVYRGGDAIAAGLSGVLRSAGFSIANIAFMAVPLALVWAGVSLWLGRKHDQMTQASERG